MRKLLKILAVLFIVIAIIVMLFKVKIKNVDVIGSERQDGTSVVDQIFEKANDRTSIIFFIKDVMGIKKDIKYVDTYHVEWLTPFSIRVLVEEKPLIGFVKKDIVNVYFDRDGLISEMTQMRIKGVPELRGVNFDAKGKGEKISASDPKVLTVLLDITDRLIKEGYEVSLIELDKNENISVYIGEIRVDLGDIQNIEVKINRLIDIYPKIKGLKGSLDLSKASENMSDEQYIFKKS